MCAVGTGSAEDMTQHSSRTRDERRAGGGGWTGGLGADFGALARNKSFFQNGTHPSAAPQFSNRHPAGAPCASLRRSRCASSRCLSATVAPTRRAMMRGSPHALAGEFRSCDARRGNARGGAGGSYRHFPARAWGAQSYLRCLRAISAPFRAGGMLTRLTGVMKGRNSSWRGMAMLLRDLLRRCLPTYAAPNLRMVLNVQSALHPTGPRREVSRLPSSLNGETIRTTNFIQFQLPVQRVVLLPILPLDPIKMLRRSIMDLKKVRDNGWCTRRQRRRICCIYSSTAFLEHDQSGLVSQTDRRQVGY